MCRVIFLLAILILSACSEKESTFSYEPIYSEKALLVSEIGESLEIIEVQTKYPIAGIPTILKSDRYYYLLEEGLVTTLHQVDFQGKLRKSMDFGNDDKLNADAISQVITKDDRVGVITYGKQITWFDEDLKEIGTEELPVKAKFHFQVDQHSIAHMNGGQDADWDIITYGPKGINYYMPIDKNRLGFYYQTFSPFAKWREKVLFSRAFNDTLYSYENGSFNPLFHVDFGANAVSNERYLQIQHPLEMLDFINERKYNYLQGEIYALDKDRVLFLLNNKGKRSVGLMDFKTNQLTVYPGIVDNSVSLMPLFHPQVAIEGDLYFGISGETMEENYDRFPDSFKHRLSPEYPESYFIYRLTLK